MAKGAVKLELTGEEAARLLAALDADDAGLRRTAEAESWRPSVLAFSLSETMGIRKKLVREIARVVANG